MKPTMSDRVVIIGAGPAGACAAGLLAAEGVDVVVLDKERFPRHHVGESLQPAAMSLLDKHLQLGPRIAAAGYARKYGAVYVWGESRQPWSVLFDERLEGRIDAMTEAELLAGDYEHAWQVDRASFDHMIVDAAIAKGADVRFGVKVDAPLMDGDRVVGVGLADGSEIRARHVIDASGQRCLIGRALKLCRVVSDLQFTATYCYLDGAGGLPGALGRHAQWVVTLPDGWAWFIPISATRTSVGVVHRQRKALSDAEFDAAVATTGFPVDGATPVPAPKGGRLWYARDWSFTNSRVAGPGFTLAGDAAAFVDPILSGGVDFAVRTGFTAAVTALRILAGDDEPGLADEYDERFRREYKAYLRLARYWYGNNRSVDGLFWQAHKEIPAQATATPLRAFVYLTTGKYAAEQHVRVFQEWQEKKMFRAIGVDAAALKRARGRKRQP